MEISAVNVLVAIVACLNTIAVMDVSWESMGGKSVHMWWEAYLGLDGLSGWIVSL